MLADKASSPSFQKTRMIVIKISNQSLTSLAIANMIVICGMSLELAAQDFVMYPNHSRGAIRGDHSVPNQWIGGPTEVTLELETDPTILLSDGPEQAQYTAERGLSFVDDGSPQNYDNPDLISRYGTQLPLLLHYSSNGTSTLSYTFTTPVSQPLDLFVVDVDAGDTVRVRAFDSLGDPVDMSTWTLAGEGDLSLVTNGGGAFSEVVAQVPTVAFTAEYIRLTLINNVNFNRSYSILRSPENAGLISRIEIEFTGFPTNTSAHIYVALATAAPAALVGDVNLDGRVSFLDISPFIAALSAGEYQIEADTDLNGFVNFLDISPFIDILSGTGS